MRRSLSRDELLEIAASLEDYHKVFFTFWEMSDVVYDDQIPTLAVELVDRSKVLDKPKMLINKEFWDRHNHREHLFMTLHECLHVILDHGERDGREVSGATHDLVNTAQDITINEMIVDVFGYDRNDLRTWKNYCWIDTCFENPRTVKHGETFTYYLKLLLAEAPQRQASGKELPKIVDVHQEKGDKSDGKGKETSEAEAQARVAVAEKLADDLTPEEIETLIDAFPESSIAGAMVGKLEIILGDKKTVKRAKVKFSALVRKLKRSRMKVVVTDYETFSRDDRRFDDVIRSSRASLPGKGERERLKKNKLLTAIFMDISGSCISYLRTFEQVFFAFDAEREIFETRLFTFDTRVNEVQPGIPIGGGGGTAFHIIEKKVLELQDEYKHYPDCVVVITDGEGDKVSPKVPENWIWLMTDYFQTNFVPAGSRWFTIKQMTF